MTQSAFWGAALKEGDSVEVTGDVRDVLRLSNACSSGAARVEMTSDVCEVPRVVVALTDKKMHAKLVVRCEQGAVLRNRGPGEVHLAGYFEPIDDGTDSEDEEAEANEEYERIVK